MLCSRACAFALQDQLVAGRVISEEDARRNKAGLRPDAFGNYLFIIRFDRTSPPTLPKEYLAGKPTYWRGVWGRFAPAQGVAPDRTGCEPAAAQAIARGKRGGAMRRRMVGLVPGWALFLAGCGSGSGAATENSGANSEGKGGVRPADEGKHRRHHEADRPEEAGPGSR